jgi:hypothetical protein
MPGFAPLRDSGFSTPRLRHCPYDEWLDGMSDALAYRLRGFRTSGPYATAAIRTRLCLSGTTRLALRASLAGSVGAGLIRYPDALVSWPPVSRSMRFRVASISLPYFSTKILVWSSSSVSSVSAASHSRRSVTSYRRRRVEPPVARRSAQETRTSASATLSTPPRP